MPRNKSLSVPPRSEYRVGSHKYSRLVLTKKELYQVADDELLNSDDHVYMYGSTGKYVLDVPVDNAEHLTAIIIAINLSSEHERLDKLWYFVLYSAVVAWVVTIVYALFFM